jgi:hypothetical protein
MPRRRQANLRYERGFQNTEARLPNLCADEASFSFVEAEDHTALATILITALGGSLQPSESSRSTESALEVDNHAPFGRG